MGQSKWIDLPQGVYPYKTMIVQQLPNSSFKNHKFSQKYFESEPIYKLQSKNQTPTGKFQQNYRPHMITIFPAVVDLFHQSLTSQLIGYVSAV